MIVCPEASSVRTWNVRSSSASFAKAIPNLSTSTLVLDSTAIPITGSGKFILSKTIGCFSAERVSPVRSEEHTSELQSRENLVCRLLLEKKNKERLEHLPPLTCRTPILYSSDHASFSFHRPPPTQIYTLSLHDALPI